MLNELNQYVNEALKDEDFSIDCTGDVVTGDTIKFEEAVFGGSFKKPKYIGSRTIVGKVVADSYGAAKQQHTFTIQLIDCTGTNCGEVTETAKKNNGKIKRKGRNVYKNGTKRLPWEDESKREEAAEEKHARGYDARQAREERKNKPYYLK